ncbi:cytochrome c biogenesis protein CcsA [Ureibacillus terrenus]|uniref:Cytochrome C assembly protein n=1 Tax=Ureibacillus terrenus TaxID=118246 RepID=A0A540V059_9BACL|nr:cytochrome c biogenesis protein CcsA [Ureibacillus terrenus]TQE90136.1 cytochrome C assembly protein [Ureibacillus terrenus]
MTKLMTDLYQIMVVLYAISIMFYFVDYFYKKVIIRRTAFWLISIVWIMQTAFIVMNVLETRRFPILSLSEGIYFYAWLLVTLSIFLHCIARVDLPVFFINILGFIFMTIRLFAPNHLNPVLKTLESEMLFIHISFAILSYAAFSLSFVFSVLYLILYRLLKKKKYTKLWSRLPSLSQTAQYMNYSVIVAIPIMVISLLLGLESAFMKVDTVSIFDAKIVGSFIVLIIYVAVLILKRRGKITGLSYAWAQVYAYFVVLINFFLGSKLSEFHLWY